MEVCAHRSEVARLCQAFSDPQQTSGHAILGYAASVDCTDDERKKTNKQNEEEFKSKRGPSQLSSLPHFI